MPRKNLSASLRWQVFARDGFRCRYCGVQAGEDGVALHADHVVSVADGGTNAMDNLVTACQRCNGGKSARSLDSAPGSAAAVAVAERSAATLRQQAKAIGQNIKAKEELEFAIFDMLCAAYGEKYVHLSDQSMKIYASLVGEFGTDAVAEWIDLASTKTTCWQSIKYVCGCARNRRAGAGA